MLARIDRRTVPVHGPNRLTVVTFTGGRHGRREAGRYNFWTACGRDQWGPWTIVCRNRERLPWGERFTRIKRERLTAGNKEDRAAYAACWKLVREAAYIRPATMRELARWAASHKADWEYLKQISYDGRLFDKLPEALR